MLRLLRRVLDRIVDKVRNAELFFFNAAVLRRRGTVHSICGKDLHARKHATLVARRRGTIHSICEVRTLYYNSKKVWQKGPYIFYANYFYQGL